MKFAWALMLLFVAACSTYRGQNRVQEDIVKFPGGVYEDKTWDDTLVFERNQFYIGATLYYDLLSTKIEPGSPFANWMGNDKELVSKCEDFYVFMAYRNIRRAIPQSSVEAQIEAQGGKVSLLPDFRRNVREHFVSDEMHFLGHKVVGVCFSEKLPASSSKRELFLTLPGFKKTDLLN